MASELAFLVRTLADFARSKAGVDVPVMLSFDDGDEIPANCGVLYKVRLGQPLEPPEGPEAPGPRSDHWSDPPAPPGRPSPPSRGACAPEQPPRRVGYCRTPRDEWSDSWLDEGA